MFSSAAAAATARDLAQAWRQWGLGVQLGAIHPKEAYNFDLERLVACVAVHEEPDGCLLEPG